MPSLTLSPLNIARFHSMTDSSGDCWIWRGVTVRKGYGRFTLRVNGKHKMLAAHRVAYELGYGPIPDGLHIDHTCHNTGCVNPSHLRTVTAKQNNENIKGAQSRNQSGARGVTLHKPSGLWRARVRHQGVEYALGYFTTVEAASEAARDKRNELFTHNDADKTED